MRKITMMILALLCIVVSVAQLKNQTQKLNARGGGVSENSLYQNSSDDGKLEFKLFRFADDDKAYKVMVDKDDIQDTHYEGMKEQTRGTASHTLISGGGFGGMTNFGAFGSIGKSCSFSKDGFDQINAAYYYLILGNCTKIPAICKSNEGIAYSGKKIKPVAIRSHVYKNEELISEQISNMTFGISKMETQKSESYRDNSFRIDHSHYARGGVLLPNGEKIDTCAALVKVKFAINHSEEIKEDDIFHIFTYIEHHDTPEVLFEEYMKEKPSLSSLRRVAESEDHVATHMDINVIPIKGTRVCPGNDRKD